jgi:hypothetical protein
VEATVAVDTQLAVLDAIYDILVADTALKSAMGGTVRLYPVQASPDTAFPFLVHRLDINGDEPFPMRNATYYLDVFSDTVNITEVTTIRQRLINLLDEYIFTVTDAVQSARIWLQTDGFVPEVETGVWHYALQFNIRLYRTGEVAAIIAR